MTEALATLFEGKEIRVVEKDGDTWMPCKDLGVALGLDRSTLYHHVQRNLDFFKGVVQDGDNLSPDGGDYWVNEQGLYLLLARISTGRVTPAARAAIIQFRRAIPAFLQQYRKKEIMHVPPASKPAALDNEILHARKLAERCGKNPDAFLAIALEKCGEMDYVKALQQSPAVVHGEPGWYNITQLVPLCNDPLLNPERLNYFLMNRGFQYRDENRLWRLTPSGMDHGREYLYTSPHQHSEIRISWRESVLYASGLKRSLSVSQAQLPARAW